MVAAQIEFPFSGARKVRAVFDADPISSDGGALLLRQVDRRLGLLDSLAAALPDPCDPRYVEHTLVELLQQRVYGIALGYEDCNDATTLRRDPVLKTCCGRDPFSDDNLASQPTLSRLENVDPDRAQHVMSLINQSRGGKDYRAEFGTRMVGTGVFAQLLRKRFEVAKRRLGFENEHRNELRTDLFRPPAKPANNAGQMTLGF